MFAFICYVFRDHAAELGNAVPEKPLLFMKPPSSYILEGTPIKVTYDDIIFFLSLPVLIQPLNSHFFCILWVPSHIYSLFFVPCRFLEVVVPSTMKLSWEL